MDITVLSQLFGYSPGYIYIFNGQIPGESDSYAYITGELAKAANDNSIVSMVTYYGNYFIVYCQQSVTSENFTLYGEVQQPAPPVVEQPKGGE